MEKQTENMINNPMDTSERFYKATEPMPNTKSGKLRLVPAVLFVVFIFAMAIWFIFNPKADYSSSEKRILQKFPEVSVENVLSGKFSEDFESFFADQFPARNMWVGFNAYYTLGTGVNGANGVYKCDDDYLINVPVSKENNITKNVSAIADFKEKIGDTPLTVLFAPSTGYVADDKLPSIHNSYNDDEYFDNTADTLAKSGIAFVDLRDSFKQAYSDGTQLYYKTDHHWTTAGAYTAYTQLCGQLGTKAADKNIFDVKTFDNFYGTTYSTSGFWLTPPDKIEVWDNPDNTEKNIKVKITDGETKIESGSMYFYDHISEDDKYPVFLDGNHPYTEVTNTNAQGGTILLIKDSFSHSLAPFLAENYSKVIMVDMRYYKQSVSQLVKDEKPEQVVVLYGIDNIATDTDIVWLQ